MIERRAVAATVVLVVSAATVGVNLTATGIATAAPSEVSDCTTIDTAGAYELGRDVSTGDDGGPCIRITASDVTFDGNGHTIESSDSGGSEPTVVAGGSGPLSNVTVRDVRLRERGFQYESILFDGVSDGRIADVRVVPLGTDPLAVVSVVGDDNTVTGLTGLPTLTVVGDDNRVTDSVVQSVVDPRRCRSTATGTSSETLPPTGRSE